MTDPLLDAPPDPNEAAAKMLEAMAERIRRNRGDKFGGCFVVIPPQNGGDPMHYLSQDSMEDPALFYQLLTARIKAVLEKVDEQARMGQMRR